MMNGSNSISPVKHEQPTLSTAHEADASADSNCQAVSNKTVAVGSSRLTEKNIIKNLVLNNVKWGDITVGDIVSQRIQHKGMVVKSVVTILGYKADLFTFEQIWQICGYLRVMGYQGGPLNCCNQ